MIIIIDSKRKKNTKMVIDQSVKRSMTSTNGTFLECMTSNNRVEMEMNLSVYIKNEIVTLRFPPYLFYYFIRYFHHSNYEHHTSNARRNFSVNVEFTLIHFVTTCFHVTTEKFFINKYDGRKVFVTVCRIYGKN